jgi:hypothetical protein
LLPAVPGSADAAFVFFFFFFFLNLVCTSPFFVLPVWPDLILYTTSIIGCSSLLDSSRRDSSWIEGVRSRDPPFLLQKPCVALQIDSTAEYSIDEVDVVVGDVSSSEANDDISSSELGGDEVS